MKKYINKLLIIVLVLATAVSCKEPTNAIYDVFDGITHGAALRELAVTSAAYDKADLNSKFEIIVEVQDEQDGALLSSVGVYVTFTDKFTDDPIDNSKDETLLKSVDASAFSTGDNGYPSTTISVTLGEVITLFSLVDGEFNAGDLIDIRFEVVLTDGRTFSSADASGSLQGSYFSSSYAYTAAILCKPLPGDYRVDMHDSYGDGWQTDDASGGSGIQVTIEAADGTESVVEIGMCSPYAPSDFTCVGTDGYEATDIVTIPAGSAAAGWYFPGDVYGEISFEVYAPDGSLLYASPGGAGKGALPIVLCAP